MATRQDVVDAARSLLGTPFRLQGRDEQGIDCVGLLCYVGREIGDEIVDHPTYSTDPDTQQFLKYIEEQSDPAPKTPIKHGSIVLLRQAIFPMHCGIITMDKRKPHIIHAYEDRGVIETWLQPFLTNVIKFRDFRGIED